MLRVTRHSVKYLVLGAWFLVLLSVQLPSALSAQTMQDIEEMVKKRAEMERLQAATEKVTKDTVTVEEPTMTKVPVPKEPPVVAPEPVPYFGYDFLETRGTLAIWDNLPVPSDYTLGPGDEIVISIWGETQLRSTHVVNRDGNIFIDKVGQVNLAGKNMEEAERHLRSQLERVHATLKNPESTTYMDVTLGKLKSINVKFVGEVNAPGIHPVHPFSTAITGLIQTGGVNTTGSLRSIQVIRDNKVASEVDLYAFLLEGKTERDIRLHDQDVVFVPVRESTVKITGEIRRPALYEAKTGESLEELIEYSGGMKPTGGMQALVDRIVPMGKRTSDDVAVRTELVSIDKAFDLVLRDGDDIVVRKIHDVDRKVSIEGQVKVPGTYSLSPEMRVRDLLKLAGGVFDDEYWETVYPYRADLVRSYDMGTRTVIIPIKLKALRNGDDGQNFLLQADDRLVVYPVDVNLYKKVVSIFGEVRKPGDYVLDENMGISDLILRAGGLSYSAYPHEVEVVRVDPFNISSDNLSSVLKTEISEDIFDSYPELDEFDLQDHDQVIIRRYPRFQYQRNVTIAGEVKFPGVYALRSEGETLEDLLARAGGFTEEAFEEGIDMRRAGERVVLRDYTIPLAPGDNIDVPRHPNVVMVAGEVYNPGFIHHKKGKSLKGYIESAGGYTLDADKGNISVIYANGDVKRRKWFLLTFDPKVEEGAMVVVQREEEKEPFDSTEFLKEVASIAASMATIWYIVSR